MATRPAHSLNVSQIVRRAFGPWLAASIIAAASAAYAQQESPTVPLGEQLASGVSRFHASSAARDSAHPSYALVREPAADGKLPAAAVGRVKPMFSTEAGKQIVKISIDAGTSLYGTGEVPGSLLRNGRRTVCWNTDAYGYGDEAESLYQSHPWVLAVRADGSAFGVLADTTYRCEVDTAYADPTLIEFKADGPAFPVIVMEGATPQDVLRHLATMTGHMALPPLWALGYHQCRYSYYPEARGREIAKGFRDRSIPCDVIWFDIDYMEAFRVFTFDRGYFPDPKKLNADLLAQGFHNVWMIDPGMKSRPERGPADRPQKELDSDPENVRKARAAEVASFDAMMKSGDAADVWVKRADGTVYEGEVWPGWCKFPDYTRPANRAWWSKLYPDFIGQGITGVWNDMNEPAVFNVKSKTMPEDNRHAGDPAMIKPNGQPQGEAGAKGDHARYHNVYGMQMIRGTREGIVALRPEHRPFVLSRANYVGGQRYGATWTGDNSADWFHLEASIPMALNVGLSGQPFIGPDVGGFAGNGDAEMFSRWIGFGAMLPFSRGHTGKGNVDKEPWSFGPKVEATAREALNRRYRLIPYYYTLFREASVSGLPVARPLFFADPADPALRSEDDAFLLGSDVLIAAALVPDRSRSVAMPRGVWREFEKSADPDLPKMFVRAGAIVPSGPTIQFTGEKPLDPLTLTVSLDATGHAIGMLYEDAGDGYGYTKGEYLHSTYTAIQKGATVTVSLTNADGKMPRAKRLVVVKVLTDKGVVQASGTDGQAITVMLE